MSVIIDIKGTPIEFPSTGESPNWAPSVIQFAEATAEAIKSVVNAYDIPLTSIPIQSDNIDIGFFNITELNFSPAVINSFILSYSLIFDGSNCESGTIIAHYNGGEDADKKWVFSRDYVGEAQTNFKITDDGQVQLDVTGTFTSGVFRFSAKVFDNG